MFIFVLSEYFRTMQDSNERKSYRDRGSSSLERYLENNRHLQEVFKASGEKMRKENARTLDDYSLVHG